MSTHEVLALERSRDKTFSEMEVANIPLNPVGVNGRTLMQLTHNTVYLV